MTNIQKSLLGVAIVGLVVAGAAAVGWRATKADLLSPDDPAVTSAGEALYMEHCAACHGAELEGQPNWRQRNEDGRLPAPPHDASGHTWHHASAVLFEVTKYGTAAFAGADYQTDMVGFGEILSDSEILAILSFIKSTWPAEIRERHDLITAQSEDQ